MKLQQVHYVGGLSTTEQIRHLFSEYPQESINKLCKQVSPVLYQLYIQYENGESIIYRSHDEIIRFLEQCLSKSKELRRIEGAASFDSIKKSEVINVIKEIQGIQNQEWFQEFFGFVGQIKGRSFSVDLKKQSGGRYSQIKCCFCLNWKKCKAFVMYDGVITYNKSKEKIQQFLHFGKDFSWQIYGNMDDHIIIIHSYHRKMTLKAENSTDFFLFLYCLEKSLGSYQKNQIQYRFNSFAPVRRNNKVKFYIDGADYFEDLAYGIQNATQQVFMCGWWISPEFSLIRPCEGKNKDYRLDNLLARTAQKGVKIYIVVYYESSFLTNDSAYTIEALQALHTNIKVLRHPQIVLPTYWSHHEKLVVIDQSFAFLGGLDICYGRYDDPSHHIKQPNQKMYPGIQYNNCRRRDFIEVRKFTIENIQKTLPRLPWHDIALMVKGDCVKDLSRHFIEYWNYSSYQTHYAGRYVLVSTSNKVIPKKKTGIWNAFKDFTTEVKSKVNLSQKQKQPKQKPPIQPAARQQIMENISEEGQPERSIPKLPPKKKMSLVQTIQKIIPIKKQNPSSNSETKTYTDKMSDKRQSPSSQLMYFNNITKREQSDGINVQEIQYDIKHEEEKNRKPPTAEQILQEEMQKQERKRIEKKQLQLKETFNQIQQIVQQIQNKQHIQEKVQDDYLQEKKDKIQLPPKRSSLQFFTELTNKMMRKPHSFHQNKIKPNNIQTQQDEEQNYGCQALRSASQWSIGSKEYEKSIYDAYLSLISKSEKFIYIENQFFISATHLNGVVKNKIMQAIADRVIRAIKNQQQFKVIVMMPLVPGFAGQLDDPSASLPRVIMNWQYRTICRGQNSLLGRIVAQTEIDDPHRYVQFFGLRTHGVINDVPFTEIIYLHSKLMIVDDRYLICGSANINDRSMEGNRDSELCLLVEGTPKAQIMINKKPYKVVQKIHKLRTKLWEEHFGISEYEARNPNDKAIWEQINNIAKTNTLIYKQVFGCYPDNDITNLIDIAKFRKSVNPEQYKQHEPKIKGHAVLFPLKFLQKQKLTSYHPHAISI